MGNMSYCRHENTASDLQDVYDQWLDFDPERATEHEKRGRRRIVQLVRDMHEEFEDDGTYDEFEVSA